MSQQTQKRPPSPLPGQNAKRIILHDGLNGKMSEISHESLRTLLQEVLVRQVELVEQVVFKDRECQKLKRKFDEIDRNCRRWHDYAISLQVKVRRLALVLHRQRESMKNLKDKSSNAVDAAVQTDHSHSPKTKTWLETSKNGKESQSTRIKTETEITAKSGSGFNSSVVIDLTDEEKKKNETSVQSNRQLKNGVVHKPLVPVLPINAPSVNQQIRQDNLVNAVTSKGKTTAPKSVTEHLANAKGSLLPQTFNATSPVKTVSNIIPPYPPLPPKPIPSNLPKNLPSPPPQPMLRIRKSEDGMELSWNHITSANQVKIECYELYVFQDNPNNHASVRWKKIGSEPIAAMALPMACTLSQFSSSSRYYFAVRGKDIYGRYGSFSTPCCSTDVHK